MIRMRLNCRVINKGSVEGEALITKEPISFLGGVNPKTGIIVEKGHELEGECITDKILIFPCGKGSTVGSYVVYAAKKNGVGPKAIINSESEPIVVVGAIISDIPIVEVDLTDLNVKTGDKVIIDAENGVVIF